MNLQREKAFAEVMIAACREELISGAHDLAAGGLIQAFAETCLQDTTGVRVATPDCADPTVFLFSESAGRTIVAVSQAQESGPTYRALAKWRFVR